MVAFALMPIVASVIVEDAPQMDGRRWVRERHTDHLGAAHDVLYLALAEADAEAIMAARVSAIEAQLAAAEIAANVEEAASKAEPTLSFEHSSRAALNAALRERYRTSEQVEAVIIGAYFAQRPDDEVAAAFGLDTSDPEFAALRSRLAAKLALMQQGAVEAGT